MRRFIDFDSQKGMANDEIVNIYAAVLNWSPDVVPGQTPGHFGSIFGLPPPSRKYKIMTTFFYPRLKELVRLRQPDTGSPERATQSQQQLVRWFKKVN